MNHFYLQKQSLNMLLLENRLPLTFFIFVFDSMNRLRLTENHLRFHQNEKTPPPAFPINALCADRSTGNPIIQYP